MEQKDFEIEAKRIRPLLYRQALHYLNNSDDADDVAQEVLIKLWSIRRQLEEYRSVEALALVITKHLCFNRLRKVTYQMCDWSKENITDETTPEDVYITKEEAGCIEKMIKTLPDIQQATLRMKHIDGLEVAEIARIIGSSEVAVRTNLSRARKKMMNYFGINR